MKNYIPRPLPIAQLTDSMNDCSAVQLLPERFRIASLSFYEMKIEQIDKENRNSGSALTAERYFE